MFPRHAVPDQVQATKARQTRHHHVRPCCTSITSRRGRAEGPPPTVFGKCSASSGSNNCSCTHATTLTSVKRGAAHLKTSVLQRLNSLNVRWHSNARAKAILGARGTGRGRCLQGLFRQIQKVSRTPPLTLGRSHQCAPISNGFGHVFLRQGVRSHHHHQTGCCLFRGGMQPSATT